LKSQIERIEFIGAITSISSFAFKGCPLLTEVNIPDTVTSIGTLTFGSCENLRVLTLPASVTEMKSIAAGCKSLTEITVDENNQYYKSVDGILYSKDGTLLVNFPCGKNVSNVTIADNVTSIELWAFCKCDSFISVTMPDSVTEIGNCAFSNCRNLKTVRLSNSLKKLQYQTFMGCTSLKMVEIPGSVTSIEDQAFNSCRNLSLVSYGGASSPSSGPNVFVGSDLVTSVCVPSNYNSDKFCGVKVVKNGNCHKYLCNSQNDPELRGICGDKEPSLGNNVQSSVVLLVCCFMMTLLIIF